MPRTLREVEASEAKEEGYPPIERIIATIASITTVSILFAAYRESLPSAAQALVLSVIAILVILFVVWVWYRPLQRGFGNWRRERIARRHYLQLVRFCERFRGFTEYNMSNTPQYVIGNIRNNPGFESVYLVEPHYFDFLSYELQNGVKTLKPNLKTFVWVADLLTTMIRFYSEVFVAKPVVQIRTIMDSGLGKIVPTYRDDYNAARERFVGFVSEYEEFISKVNGELGQVRRKVGDSWRNEELLRSYHIERPKEL